MWLVDIINQLWSDLDIGWWNAGLASAAALLVGWTVIRAPRTAATEGAKFAAKHSAYVDVAFVRQFDSVSVRERRRTYLTRSLPFVLILLVLNDVTIALMPGLLALSMATENVLRLRRIGSEFDAVAPPHGLARARAVGIRDYIGPAGIACWLAVAFVAVAVGIGFAVAVVRHGFTPLLLADLLSAAALGILALTLPVCSWVIVGRPERSEDAAHLYLQDAWRANLLREATLAALLPALYFMITVPETRGFPVVLGVVAAGALGFCLLSSTFLGDKNLHFRKRLWPTLKPGQVLMPGDSVPAGAPA